MAVDEPDPSHDPDRIGAFHAEHLRHVRRRLSFFESEQSSGDVAGVPEDVLERPRNLRYPSDLAWTMADKRTPASLADNEAFGRKRRERLPTRNPTHTILARQLGLGGQAVAGAHTSAEDAVAEDVLDALVTGEVAQHIRLRVDPGQLVTPLVRHVGGIHYCYVDRTRAQACLCCQARWSS